MPTYRYRAVAPDGSALEDVIDAPSAHQATLRLQERGYTVNSLEPVQGEFTAAPRGGQLPWTDLELLARQLLSITERNLPMVPALKAMAADMDAPRLKGVVDQVRIDLERGASIEEALRNRGGAVPPLFASAVRAGEASGIGLPGVLRILVQHAGRMVQLHGSLQAALAYPLIVTVLACAVLLIVTTQLAPGANALAGFNVYGGVNRFHGLTAFVAEHTLGLSLAGVALCAGAFLLTRRLRRGHAHSLRADRARMRVPGFGKVYYLITVARFSRTLAALLAARVPVVESLELAAAASGSPLLQQAVGGAAPRVALGETLAGALGASDYFGKAYCWLLGVAEQRNAAEEALENLAEAAEREAAAQDQLNLQLIGPLALVIAGIVVLLVSFQFILPVSGGIFGSMGLYS